MSRMHADGPGRAFIELKYYGVEFGQGFMEVWHFNGTAWVRKVRLQASGSAGFACGRWGVVPLRCVEQLGNRHRIN